MKFAAAIALVALAVPVAPVVAQRGGGHAGSAGGRGSAGRASISGGAGFSRPGGYAPAQPFRYGTMGNPATERSGPRGYSSPRFSYNGNGFSSYRPSYQQGLAGRSGEESDRFRERRREFNTWYTNIYPAWLGYGYPYTLNPGFFPWGDDDDSADDNSGYDQGAAPPAYPAPYDEEPGYPAPYPDEGFGAGNQLYAASGSAISSAPAPGQPLTVFFKDGRAPVTVQNYMLTTKVFTDLDPQHYAQIPLDQIDLAATQQANSAAGVDFQVPGAASD